MRRRSFLGAMATGLAGALAGCNGDPTASLTLAAVDDDAALVAKYAREAPLHYENEWVVARAVENGSVTVQDTHPAISTRRPFEYEGRFYELQEAEIGSEAATEYRFDVTLLGEGPPEAGDVAFEELSEADRLWLRREVLLPPPDGTPEADFSSYHGAIGYTDAQAERSVLAGDDEETIVVEGGYRYRIAVEERGTTTLYTYRYTAEQVAPDEAAMARQVREQYRCSLSGLSPAQRRIMEAAREDSYQEHEPTEAFRDLARRIRSHDAIEDYDTFGRWLLRYDGSDYWTELTTPQLYRNATVARETPSEY